MTITANKVVAIHYTLKNTAGDIIDSSEEHGPLNYLHGAGNIIPGLENALAGKTSGDQLDVTIPPEEAYGDRSDNLKQAIPRSSFKDVAEDVKPGLNFQVETSHGPITVVVLEVNEESVIVDANHPLAGETLHFSVAIDSVRDATEEEISHGHVHSGDDHHHA